MRFGIHIRTADGLVKALDYARKLRCQAVQLFSGNPSAWRIKPLDPDAAQEFAGLTAEWDMRPVVAHTPYLLNLASPDDDIWRKSTDALSEAVRRAQLLGASCVVTHIGSHRGSGYQAGVERICAAVEKALAVESDVTIALELGAGAGNSIGSRFEHTADILDCISRGRDRVGICIDTAHLWAAGYDVSTKPGVDAMFESLEQCVGFDRLKVVHLNDTQKDIGSHADRHYHIGKGQIGLQGFEAVVNRPELAGLPGIIETPADNERADRGNLTVLRKLQKA